MVLICCAPEGPGDGFGCGLDARRHAQVILAPCRGILHLNITGYLVRIVRQRDFVEHALRAAIDVGGRQFPYKALRAHALLDDAPRLDVALAKEIIARELIRLQDHSLRHWHAVPGEEAPAITVLDAAAGGAVETAGVVEGKESWLAHHQGDVFTEPVAGDHLVEVSQRMSLLARKRPAKVLRQGQRRRFIVRSDAVPDG